MQAGSNGLSIESWIERDVAEPDTFVHRKPLILVAISPGTSPAACPGQTLISLMEHFGRIDLSFSFDDGDGTQGCASVRAVRTH